MKQKDVDISAIMREFDTYVQLSLKNKTSSEEPERQRNELDQYYQNMQKRLKIKTVSPDQKFEKMIGPMKKLKSFVSIKQFLKGLNQKSFKPDNQTVVSQTTKRKLEYEDLRGGLYMEKVENHLRQNHMKRKLDQQAEYLLRELEEHQTQKNEYRTWMENVLGKINMKEECFLNSIERSDPFADEKSKTKEFVLTEIANNTNNTDIKKAKRENLKRRMSEQKEQQNFKKVSNFLADRLRKILTDKYVNNSAKQSKKNKEMMNSFNFDESFKMVTQPPPTMTLTASYRKNFCKTTATSKRIRQSTNTGGFSYRAQTTEIRNRKGNEEIWKQKLHSKMDNFMSTTNQFYQKCQEEKKEYRKLTNPYVELIKEDEEK